MGLKVGKPLWLIFIPITLALLYVAYRKLSARVSMKKKAALILRSLVFIFLLLSMSSLGMVWTIDDSATIFLVDSSDSMKDYKGDIDPFIKESLKGMTDKDRAGIILFGEEPEMESFLSKDPVFQGAGTVHKSQYTNIEKAITAGISVLPDKSKKRIVLVTDGEENQGDSSRTAGFFREKGVDFKVFKINRDKGKDVAITKITVPQSLRKGEEYNITVNVKSNIDTRGKLTLFDGDEMASEEVVEIGKGENRFVFRDRAVTTGFKIYRAIIDPEEDDESRNNEASTFTNIQDEPKVLLIEGSAGEGEEIGRMLEGAKALYEKISVQSAPTTLQRLSQYKSIVLSNVSAEDLNDGFLEALEPYVRDFGGGLLVAGGENSFALGGYFNTSIEKVLPVDMELKGKKAIPDMAIVLVIDKSGSMGGSGKGVSKMDLAKESAARVLDSLRDNDKIGVLAFDNAMYWVVKPQVAEDRERIRNDIGTIMQGGGTSILPPLEEAVKTIKGLDSKIKHVILLTDGQAEKTGYDKVLQEAVSSGITVSTVAVGSDADSNLLEYISQKAEGRFYQTDEHSNLPSIFAKETLMATRSYLNNREFVPRVVSFHPAIEDGVSGGLPSLKGYIAASPKDAAQVLLESDEGDPILTFWQYGLGKTVAWNSDMTGRWSANYVNWENNMLFWNNIINLTIENYEEMDLEIDTHIDGGVAIINVKQLDSNEEYETKAIVTTPSLKSMEVVLDIEAPGQYKGSLSLDEIGVYLIKIIQSKEGEVKRAANTGISLPYSPEYAIDGSTESLDRLVNEAGGRYIKEAKEVYEGNINDVTDKRDLSSLFMIIALLLFLVDIALRRLNLPLERVITPFKKFLRSTKIIKGKEKKRSSMGSTDRGKRHITVKEDIIASEPRREKNIERNRDKKQKEKQITSETLDTAALLRRKHKK